MKYHFLILLLLCCLSSCKQDAKTDIQSKPKVEMEEGKQKKRKKKKQKKKRKKKKRKKKKKVKKSKNTKVTVPKKKKKVKKYASFTWDEMVHKFGEIIEGDIVDHKFKFTNNSNVPIQIKSAKASCGCTHPSFPFIDIMPGESNQISVRYHSVSKSGDQTAEITIDANTNPPITVLKLEGFVKEKPKTEDKEEGQETPTDVIDVDLPPIKEPTKPRTVKKGKGTVISMPKDTSETGNN